jgi:diguanylate cyclase (GGDEF)-like protein/PAS domain S-box-containing protein
LGDLNHQALSKRSLFAKQNRPFLHPIVWQKVKVLWTGKSHEILALAILYFLTAKLGQTLAIPPGNVTPVWIPSGIILAAVLVKGYGIWPGIFLGAFAGNVSAYFSPDSAAAIVRALIAGTANGLGDSLCALVGAFLILKYTRNPFPFNRLSHVFRFIVYGAIAGSFISALFGVTGLWAMGFLPWDQYGPVFLTWWTGDGVGVLILTPILLSLLCPPPSQSHKPGTRLETLFYLGALTTTAFYSLGFSEQQLGHVGLFALLPLSMWSIFRLSQRVTHASILIIASLAITFTALNVGWLQGKALNDALIELQLFMATISISLLILDSIFIQKQTAERSLHRLNTTLEQRVHQRTVELEHERDSLSQSEAKIRWLIDNIFAGVVVHGADTSVLSCNHQAEKILGLSLSQMQGKTAIDPYWQFIDNSGHTMQVQDYPVSQVVRTLTPLKDIVLGILRPDHDEITWVLVNGTPLFDPQGACIEVIISFVDITELRKAEERNRHSSVVFENTAEGVLITDLQANIINANQAFTTITGYSKEEVIGQNVRFLQSGKHDQAFYKTLWTTILQDGSWHGEIWNRRKDGSIYPELLTISTVRGEQGQATAYVAVFSDITKLKQSEKRLNYLAHHDPLTDLPNRLLFNSQLQQSIKQAVRRRSSLAVVLIDLDHFKSVNDTLGHQAGDELLKQVARRLKQTIRDNDILARISGDEFILLLEDISTPEAASVVLEKLKAVVKKPFEIAGTKLYVLSSMGVSLFPQDGETASELIRNADMAMYRAKEDGRNTHKFFTADLTDKALRHAQLENAMREALVRQEFYPVYQPQINLQTGCVIGMEVLLRWQSAEMGWVSPGVFIPAAEQNGMIRELGEWVLETACRQGKVWLDQGLDIGWIAVNISGKQLQARNFADNVRQILERTEFPTQHLELEVTESCVMQVPEISIQQLEMLKALGIQISIDDFGTGYSSLSYLKRLPIDKLKIDQAFIRDIYTDADDMAITSSVIALGHALELTVIAEGVETEEQAQFLKDQCCDEAQGYLYSKPISTDQIPPFLKDWCKGGHLDQ